MSYIKKNWNYTTHVRQTVEGGTLVRRNQSDFTAQNKVHYTIHVTPTMECGRLLRMNPSNVTAHNKAHYTTRVPSTIERGRLDDSDRRLEFGETVIIRSEAGSNFLRSILFCNKASFKLNGRVNRHNCVYWSDVNPHNVIQAECNVPGVMKVPKLRNNYVFNIHSLMWQQYSAPAHIGIQVLDVLNNSFNEWIGRRGTINWPVRSPDLNA
ncbi:hypothetical protein J6590_024785 [Homalodisca vitripennis]|nr:hypothetical protein J6590_024779 [Homalodisca vitripennis]KAG8317558.1 hypothetical protein J6590_024785 [Homalodisca vitripennis]